MNEFVEGFLKRNLGRYLKDFNSNNVSVSLTGYVELTDIELNVEGMNELQLSYKLACVYFGKVALQLPLLPTSEFLLEVKDVLIILERNHSVSMLDITKAQKALQTLIGMMYFSMMNHARKQVAMAELDGGGNGFSTVDLEYQLRMIDRFHLVVDNVHFRLEDAVNSHLSYFDEEDNMALGIMVEHLDIHVPSYEDLSADSRLGEQDPDKRVWRDEAEYQKLGTTILINKIVNLSHLHVYIVREPSLIPSKVDSQQRMDIALSSYTGSSDEGDDGKTRARKKDRNGKRKPRTATEMYTKHRKVLALDSDTGAIRKQFVQTQFYHRENGTVIENGNLSVKLSFCYQVDHQAFGPITLNATCEGMHLHLTDLHVPFVWQVAHNVVRQNSCLQDICMLHAYRLSRSIGTKSSSATAPGGFDKKRRAKLRWAMLRRFVTKEWHQYSTELREGTQRWKTWFNQWRSCAQYIAVRELLLHHIGFERINSASQAGPNVAPVAFAMSESLIMDHTASWDYMDFAAETLNQGSFSEDNRPSHPTFKKPYRGYGGVSESMLEGAKKKMRARLANYTDYKSLAQGFSAMALTTKEVRALYALQLELDTFLPPQTAARCRIWADDRFRLARERLRAEEALATNETSSVEADQDDHIESVLLVGLADAANLNGGSLGMQAVEVQCTLETRLYPQSSVTMPMLSPLVASETGAPSDGCIGIQKDVSNWKAAKIHGISNSGMAVFNQRFELDLMWPPDDEDNDGSAASSAPSSRRDIPLTNEADLIVDCDCKGVFSPSYGRAVVPLSLLIGDSDVRKAVITNLELKSTFKGPVNELFVNLRNKDSGWATPATPTLVHDTYYHVCDISDTRQPDESSCCIRLLSQVVTGPSGKINQARLAFEAKLKESCERSREQFNNQLSMLKRSAGKDDDDDEDDDDDFILDPSVLTVQNLRIQLEAKDDLSLTYSCLYLPPAQFRKEAKLQKISTPQSVPIPVAKVQLKSLTLSCQASNNPWHLKGSCSADEAIVSLATLPGTHAQSKQEATTLRPLVLLPPMHANFNAEQVSTQGRDLCGWGGSNLDESCFDWTLQLSLGPVHLSLGPSTSPFRKIDNDEAVYRFASTKTVLDEEHEEEHTITKQKSGSSGNKDKTVAWHDYKLLSHLFRPEATGWSRGFFTHHLAANGSAPPSRSPEAELRLGGPYCDMPCHRNVVTDVLLFYRYHSEEGAPTAEHSDNKAGANKEDYLPPLLQQWTSIVSNTMSRSWSTSLQFVADKWELLGKDSYGGQSTLGELDCGDDSDTGDEISDTMTTGTQEDDDVLEDDDIVFGNKVVSRPHTGKTTEQRVKLDAEVNVFTAISSFFAGEVTPLSTEETAQASNASAFVRHKEEKEEKEKEANKTHLQYFKQQEKLWMHDKAKLLERIKQLEVAAEQAEIAREREMKDKAKIAELEAALAERSVAPWAQAN